MEGARGNWDAGRLHDTHLDLDVPETLVGHPELFLQGGSFGEMVAIPALNPPRRRRRPYNNKVEERLAN